MIHPKSHISYPIILTIAISFVPLSWLTLTKACEVGIIKSYFRDEKNETQGGQVTYPLSCIYLVRGRASQRC